MHISNPFETSVNRTLLLSVQKLPGTAAQSGTSTKHPTPRNCTQKQRCCHTHPEPGGHLNTVWFADPSSGLYTRVSSKQTSQHIKAALGFPFTAYFKNQTAFPLEQGKHSSFLIKNSYCPASNCAGRQPGLQTGSC